MPDKAPLHKIPLATLGGVARVIEFGDAKYMPGDWVNRSVDDHMGGALRHLAAHLDGTFLDPESNLRHLDHAICRLIMAAGVLDRIMAEAAPVKEGSDIPAP